MPDEMTPDAADEGGMKDQGRRGEDSASASERAKGGERADGGQQGRGQGGSDRGRFGVDDLEQSIRDRQGEDRGEVH